MFLLIKWSILSNLDLNSCVMLYITCDKNHDNVSIIFNLLVLHHRMIGSLHEHVTCVVTQEHELRKSPHNWSDGLMSKRQCSMHINKGDVYNICILCPLPPHLYIAFVMLHDHRIPGHPQFMGFNKTQSK